MLGALEATEGSSVSPEQWVSMSKDKAGDGAGQMTQGLSYVKVFVRVLSKRER